jgi:uncharacterized protein YdhG (YjbR/CyaY superfamily)
MAMMRNLENTDAYIRHAPKEVQALLTAMRRAIRLAAPKAEETISYGMPCFRLKGNLVYFAAFRHHIGFYPTASGIAAFKKELLPYKSSKGAVQFPLDRPLPLALIKKIVRFRVKESLANEREKSRR